MSYLKTLLLLLVLVAFVLPDTADAQLLKRIKDRAKERVESKVEDKADQAVDKAVDEAAEGVESAAASAFERRTRPEELNLGPNETGPATADVVQYRSTTSMDLGALGRMARLFGKEIEHQTETITLSSKRQRTDSENESTIIDIDQGRMFMLDHEKRQYSTFSFQEMMDRMEAARAEIASAAEQDADADVDMDMEVDFDVERTGRSEVVNGTPAE